jgi:hypothetical protein
MDRERNRGTAGIADIAMATIFGKRSTPERSAAVVLCRPRFPDGPTLKQKRTVRYGCSGGSASEKRTTKMSDGLIFCREMKYPKSHLAMEKNWKPFDKSAEHLVSIFLTVE